jgi:hypothetical protein
VKAEWKQFQLLIDQLETSQAYYQKEHDARANFVETGGPTDVINSDAAKRI